MGEGCLQHGGRGEGWEDVEEQADVGLGGQDPVFSPQGGEGGRRGGEVEVVVTYKFGFVELIVEIVGMQ